ncbi:MAG: hypothetical protein ACP5NV_01745 [Candidatus Woesearchaeota archaeon]
MRINKLDLLSKGWSVSEVDKASKIIEQAEDRKHIGIKFFDRTIYWALLFQLIIGNAVCSAFIVPFLFVAHSEFIILISAVLGFGFGVFFSILIADITRGDNKYLKWLLITFVLSGILNFALISNISIEFANKTGLIMRHNPYLIAGIYLFAFLIPHMVSIIITANNKNKQ